MSNHVSSEKQFLHVIKASAGSGKTHRLTGEYLHLLFSHPNNHRHILAVTFTNKATDEMKSRIVEELYRLASGKDSDYLKELMKEFSLKETSLRSQAKTILETILHDYSAFSISTIDRFFQQTMQAFTREMGLAGGYNIEVDPTLLLMEAVDLMLSELDRPENKMLSDWLLRFMQDNIEEGKSWKIEQEVLELAKQLFNETYKSFTSEEQATIQNKEQLENYKQMLIRIVKSYENELKSVGVRAVSIINDHHLQPSEFIGGSRSQFFKLVKIAEGEIPEMTKTFLTIPDNLKGWSSKKTTPEIENKIENAYKNGLNDCVKQVIELYQNSVPYNTAKCILQNYYTLGILNDIKERLQKLQQESKTLFLSDTTELLNDIISGSDSPFIYEKTGTRITNYMIDEFQDTSRMQWDNFKPLIGESLSSGNFNLIVGDVKQSIYRFRNSDWRLLEEQVEKDFPPGYIKKQVLDTNWRSDAHIVEFNNAFFSQAATILQNDFNLTAGTMNESGSDKDKYPGSDSRPDPDNDVTEGVDDASIDKNDQIVSAYTDVYQQLPAKKTDSGGQVKITFLKNESASDWEAEALKRLPREIESLQDQGFSLKDIAIVVRWNREAVQVAKTLIAYKEQHPESPYRYDIISNEAILIGNAQSVKAIIALMRYFRNPSDNTRRMMAVYEFYRFQRKCTPGEALRAYREETPGNFPEEMKNRLNELASMPFYDMVEGFFALSANVLDEKENAYVQAFLDIALQFSADSSADLNTFLDWWDEEGHKKTLFSPEGQDAIRLITIHKSKGLGFGAVIMPFVNWKMDHALQKDIIWCKPEVAPFDALSVVPLRYGRKLSETIFRKDYLDEKRFTYIDNLNLLYVAFTRAKHRLIIFAPVPKKHETISDVADLLWSTVSNTPHLPGSGRQQISLEDYFTEGEDECVLELGTPTKREADKNKPDIETYKTGQWHSVPFDDRLKLRLNSIGFFSDDGSRDYGKMMHDIVSNVKTLDDIPNAVELKISEGELNEPERDNTIRELTHYLSLPEISDWYSGKYNILNEVQVLHPRTGFSRPDRVMIGQNEVIVVDYKFGESETPKYIRQVRQYVKTIEEMGYSQVKGFVFYVKAGKIEKTG